MNDPLGNKQTLFGVGVNATTYDEVVDAVMAAAADRRPFGVAALATHGLMTAVHDEAFAADLARLDVVTPDGQPVRWALNRLHGVGLTDRVYGPDLTARVCAEAAAEGRSVFVFGSTDATCERMVAELRHRWPDLVIAGVQSDRFREATAEEDAADVARITSSGAGVVLVGRGCPRQERWVAAHLDRIPAAMLAVGAAFDYFAGNLRRPPAWMQRHGLEWLWRLALEPRRLLRRYVVTNTQFLARFATEVLRTRRHGAADDDGHDRTGVSDAHPVGPASDGTRRRQPAGNR